jgi:hypothetical protein
MSSLTLLFKQFIFDKLEKESIKKRHITEPIFGVDWWREMVKNDETYIDFGDASASAATPFRSRRRGSKSVQRRRKLGSKSKSRKRSSKPRRR